MPRRIRSGYRKSRTFIREWREFRKLSQEQLAEKLTTSHASISRIESGAQPYTQDTLESIADALGTDVVSLLATNPFDPADQATPIRRRTFFREWRKYRGYTLEQAAELADMSAGNISAMERGAQGYTQDGLESLAEAYRCEPAQLLMGAPNTNDIWGIWDAAGPEDRQKMLEIAKVVVGKRG